MTNNQDGPKQAKIGQKFAFLVPKRSAGLEKVRYRR